MSSSCPFSPRMSSERGDDCGGKGGPREVGEGERTVAETTWGPLPRSHGRLLLPCTLQQPKLAELRHPEGRRDPDRRERRGCCASDPVHLGVSALLSSEGRRSPLHPRPHSAARPALPRWQDKHCFLEDQQAGTATCSWKAPPALQFSLHETALRLTQAPFLARLGALPARWCLAAQRAAGKGFCLHSSSRARATGSASLFNHASIY